MLQEAPSEAHQGNRGHDSREHRVRSVHFPLRWWWQRLGAEENARQAHELGTGSPSRRLVAAAVKTIMVYKHRSIII